MTIKYDENSIRQLNWREAVRNSIGMYIGNADSDGMHHLLEEIVSNAMDESAAGYGNKITISVDSKTNQVSVQDEGRGVPFRKNKDNTYAILEVYQGLHAGGKFDGDNAYKSALGLNGVGGTVTNALSKRMHIHSVREDGTCDIIFIDGQGTPQITDGRNSKTGTLVEFIPDNTVFNNAKWDIEAIKESTQYHALLNNGITFVINYDGKEIAKYSYTNGIKDLLALKAVGEETVTKPVYNAATIAPGTPDEATVEYAFQYINKSGEYFYAFTNGGYNPDEGTHVTGFRTGYTSLINKKARELGYLTEKEDNFDGAIIRRGLLCVLSLKMVHRPQFAEQTKLKLTSPEARTICSQAIGKLELTKNQADEIIKKVETEQKAENAAKRAREASARIACGGKNLNSIKDLPENLSDCPDRNGELFICEGLSAAGGAQISRNKQNQAVLPLRGKIFSSFDADLADALEHDTIKMLVTTLGCGIGEKFNIDNLRYGKIIIMTDADPDGKHIELLLMAFFLRHMPELVKQGKVYTVESPLYKVTNNRGIKYYWSDAEVAGKSGEIRHLKGLGELEPQELYDTTLNPDNRKLLQLQPTDYDDIMVLYQILMGSSSDERKKFIFSHKISKYSQDTYVEGDE